MEGKPDGALPVHSTVGADPTAGEAPFSFGPPSQPGWVGTLDRFDLVRCVGEGGMGLVYLAHDPQRMEPVAIKLLRPEVAQSSRARAYFLKEAQHAQRLKHPHILPVLEFKETGERAYQVTPFIEQGSLSDRLRCGAPLPEGVMLAIARQIASALCFAHQHGIIHRDVKPSNVLLDAQNRPFLADFGLARSLFNDALIDVRQNHWEGTASYLSPGTARGEDEDKRGDIYSFGAVLYEMLTGRPPYIGRTREEVIAQIGAAPHQPPKPILELNPQASPALIAVVAGAMAPELRDRYATMSDVLADLEAAAKGEPPLGPRGQPVLDLSSPSAARRAKTRKRLVAASLLIALIGVLAALTVPQHELPVTPTTAKAEAPGFRLTGKLELPGVSRWSQALLDNYRGIGPLDFFVPGDTHLIIVSPEGQVINRWQVPAPSGGAFRVLARVKLPVSYYRAQASWMSNSATANPVQSKVSNAAVVPDEQRTVTLVGWHARDQVFVSVLNQLATEVKRFALPGSIHTNAMGPMADSAIMEAQVADLNGDGKLQLVVAIASGYSKKPRGISVLDYASGVLMWHREIGPVPQGLCLADIDGDGKTEILVGSDAVDNENRADDETDDNHSYIIALAHDGTRLWTFEMGDYYTSCWPLLAKLGGQGKKEILAWINSKYDSRTRNGDPELGFILRFDASGNVTARYDGDHVGLHSCLAVDIDGDQKDEVLVTDRLGQLHVLNSDLLPLREKKQIVASRYPEVWLKAWALADINGDHRRELVFTSTQREFVKGLNTGLPEGPLPVVNYYDNEVIALDLQLNEVARYRLGDKWTTDHSLRAQVADHDADGKPEVLALADKVYILRWSNQ